MSFDVYMKPYKKFRDEHPKVQCCYCYKKIDLTKPPIVSFDGGSVAYYYHARCAKKVCEKFLKDIKEAEAQITKGKKK